MERYMLTKKLPNGNYEVIARFDTIEETIELLSNHWVTEWANGFIFILENIPLVIRVN